MPCSKGITGPKRKARCRARSAQSYYYLCSLCGGVLRRAVLVGVVLGGFFAMMRRMQRVAVRNVSVVSSALVVAGFMVSSGFAVMFGCGFMMMGSLMMMVGAFVCHGYVSW
jgi:hypothetical protein